MKWIATKYELPAKNQLVLTAYLPDAIGGKVCYGTARYCGGKWDWADDWDGERVNIPDFWTPIAKVPCTL